MISGKIDAPTGRTASPSFKVDRSCSVRHELRRRCSRKAPVRLAIFCSLVPTTYCALSAPTLKCSCGSTRPLALKDAWGRIGQSPIDLAREHWWRSVGMSGFARRRGSSVGESGEHRATFVPKTPSLHARDTNSPVVGRRFLCFVSLSPLDKEMKSRHGQWLIVIKNLANIEPELT